MKVEVVGFADGSHRVKLTQGHQEFYLDYQGQSGVWMAKMFRRALAKHDLEMQDKTQRRTRC